MESKGIITHIKGNNITVKLYKEAACLHCNVCEDKKKFSKDFDFITERKVDLGDIVTFSIEGSKIAKIAIIIYIFPIIGMILGYFFSSSILGWNEERSVLTSFVFLVISFIIIFLYDKIYRKKVQNSDIEIIAVEKGDISDLI